MRLGKQLPLVVMVIEVPVHMQLLLMIAFAGKWKSVACLGISTERGLTEKVSV